MLDPRGRLLLTALDFAGLRREAGGSAVEIQSLRRWLDSWPGVGAIERDMAHQGYDLRLSFRSVTSLPTRGGDWEVTGRPYTTRGRASL